MFMVATCIKRFREQPLAIYSCGRELSNASYMYMYAVAAKKDRMFVRPFLRKLSLFCSLFL